MQPNQAPASEALQMGKTALPLSISPCSIFFRSTIGRKQIRIRPFLFGGIVRRLTMWEIYVDNNFPAALLQTFVLMYVSLSIWELS